MSEPYVGEIRMFAGNFAPRGWALCDGQLLAVSQNDALFSLLGTIYGGDGRTTFGLPDMRGRIPIHAGSGPGLSPRSIGAKIGAEEETITLGQLPPHTHLLHATSATASTLDPVGSGLGTPGSTDVYTDQLDDLVDMNSQSVGNVGGSQSHYNIQPYLCVNFIIALVGVYPSRH